MIAASSTTTFVFGSLSVGQITFETDGSLGNVAPGLVGGVGTLTAARLTGRGVFEFHIGGTTPGTGYDQLLVRRSGVYVTFTAPTVGASITAASTVVSTPAAGRASLTPTANAVAGGFQVKASLAGGVNFLFDLKNTAGGLNSLTVQPGGSPQSAVVFTTFGPVTLRAADDPGNAVGGAVITLIAPGSGATAVVPATAITANDGTATFTPTAGTVAGGYTVSAASGGKQRASDRPTSPRRRRRSRSIPAAANRRRLTPATLRWWSRH